MMDPEIAKNEVFQLIELIVPKVRAQTPTTGRTGQREAPTIPGRHR